MTKLYEKVENKDPESFWNELVKYIYETIIVYCNNEEKTSTYITAGRIIEIVKIERIVEYKDFTILLEISQSSNQRVVRSFDSCQVKFFVPLSFNSEKLEKFPAIFPYPKDEIPGGVCEGEVAERDIQKGGGEIRMKVEVDKSSSDEVTISYISLDGKVLIIPSTSEAVSTGDSYAYKCLPGVKSVYLYGPGKKNWGVYVSVDTGDKDA